MDHKKAIEILEGKRVIADQEPKRHEILKEVDDVSHAIYQTQEQVAKLNERFTGLGKFINEGLERLEEHLAQRPEPSSHIYARQPDKSPTIGHIAKALANVRAEIGIIAKGTAANRGSFSSIVDLEAVCNPVMHKYGITPKFGVQHNDFNDLVLVCYLVHESDEWFRDEVPLHEEFALSPKEGYHQRVGAAEKYMRRYMYRAMLCIAEE